MDQKRIQLTLFVEEDQCEAIEEVRRRFNPHQFGLIKAHVTLCREDELGKIEDVIVNLINLNAGYVVIDFGKAIRFSEGKGVLIPATGKNEHFHRLRERILKGQISGPGKQEPHITLMHPRNSTCTDEVFARIEQVEFPQKIEFRKISLIEQETGKKWNILREFDLKNESP